MYGFILDAAAVFPFFSIVKKEETTLKIVAQKSLGAGKELFSILFPLLTETIEQELGLTVEKFKSLLAFVGVGVGPGPFTALRSNAVIGKALCYSWSVPLLPFSSILSCLPTALEGRVYFIGDAKQNEEYVLSAFITEGRIEELSSLERIKKGEFSWEKRERGRVISLWPFEKKEDAIPHYIGEQPLLNLSWLNRHLWSLYECKKNLDPSLREIALCYFR